MEKIGKYEVVGKLGAGGFGVVYKGRDPFIERAVAIKTLTAEDLSLRTRFMREARIAGNLRHPNITTVYDFGVDDNVPYLVQEYLSGEDLDRMIVRGEPKSTERKVEILIQVAQGLEHAHREGIVHRDVKPANVRILEDGSVKIMDFGIAKVSVDTSGLTRTGTALGTVCYFSPEQFQGEATDPRSDIFSFGILAYELLCRHRPFQGSNPAMLMKQILMEDPEPVSAWWAECPERLEGAVMRCLEKRVDQRYPNLQECIAQLELVLEELKDGAPATSPGPQRPTDSASMPARSAVVPQPAPGTEDLVRSQDTDGMSPPSPGLTGTHATFASGAGRRPAQPPPAASDILRQKVLLRDTRRQIQSLLRQGDLDEAERYLSQVERDFPDAKSFWFYRDRLEKLRGQQHEGTSGVHRINSRPCPPEALALLTKTYLERTSGTVSFGRQGEEATTLCFARGELFLPLQHQRAVYLQQLLDAQTQGERSGVQPQLRKLAADLVGNLPSDGLGQMAMRETAVEELPSQRVGPLPTVMLLLELAVLGCGIKELEQRFPKDAQFVSRADSPAMQQLRGLDPDMAQVLARLDSPIRVAELTRGAGKERLGLLQGLAKLVAVGLAARQDGSEEEASAGAWLAFTRKVIRRFSDRIEADLSSDPLEITAEDHRQRIANLLSSLGERSYYQLLGVPAQATTQEIHQAYNELARVVHPCHAKRAGLEGKETAFEVLFERATEAYLTLTDPTRRSSYNLVSGVFEGVAVNDDQREEERRSLARQNYRHGSRLLSTMDFSQAVDLLKEASRMDPQPEYLSLLARAQAKNPKWWGQAKESFRQATQRQPKDVAIRLEYAKLLEQMGELVQAKAQFSEALRLDSRNLEANEGLARLRASKKGSRPASSIFRRLAGGEDG